MSSSSLLSSVACGLMVYIGLFLLITGLIGNLLSVVIFLSLKTFRQTPATVYLIVASLINNGQLINGLISRIIFNEERIDWTLTLPFYCKLRLYLVHFCAFSSMTCVTLAVLDQYLSTSARPQWQQWSNRKIAYSLSCFSLVFWLIVLSPHLVYYKLITDDQPVCLIINPIYANYVNDFLVPIIWCVLPYFLMILFGLLTYRHIKQISYRTVPLRRRLIDQQLSTMILTQVIINIFSTTPYIIYLIITTNVSFSNDSLTVARILFIRNFTLCLYYLHPSSSFYIYVCVSDRFRRQLCHVLIHIYRSRLRKRQIQPIDQPVAQSHISPTEAI